MPNAKAGAIWLDFDDVGSGQPALLLLTGWCASREAFRALSPLLAKEHRVLAMDWRGHGKSGPSPTDFGTADLVDDAAAVIEAAGARSIVPVATAHAGWVAIDLRRRFGPERVPALVLLDWIVTPAPAPFLDALKALQSPDHWKAARDGLFSMWTQGVKDVTVHDFVRKDMGAFGREMWARGGREIASAYAREGSPLEALASLTPAAPTLHIYSQPPDPGYLSAQLAFAANHPWFHVTKLETLSHFPTLEVPAEVARETEGFLRGIHA